MNIILVCIGNFQDYIIYNIYNLLLYDNNDIYIITNKEFFPVFQSNINTHITHKFKNANIIIASHGASLSNVIFMKENTSVIEIISKHKLNNDNEDTFKNLSLFCKLKHKFIITENEIDNVDIDKLKKSIEIFYNK